MSAFLRRAVVFIIGDLVTKAVVEELLNGVFRRLRERAKLTNTQVDDRAIDTLEAAFDVATAAATITDWLNARLRGA